MKKFLPLLLLLGAIPVVVAFKRAQVGAGDDAIPFFGAANARTAVAGAERAFDPVGDAAQFARGRQVYEMLCQACHMPEGQGLPGGLPPLAGADYLLADRERAIAVVLHGLSGPITVNGVGYNAAMPPLGSMLTDQQVADVMTYVFNAWGNSGAVFGAEQVRALRVGR